MAGKSLSVSCQISIEDTAPTQGALEMELKVQRSKAEQEEAQRRAKLALAEKLGVLDQGVPHVCLFHEALASEDPHCTSLMDIDTVTTAKQLAKRLRMSLHTSGLLSASDQPSSATLTAHVCAT